MARRWRLRPNRHCLPSHFQLWTRRGRIAPRRWRRRVTGSTRRAIRQLAVPKRRAPPGQQRMPSAYMLAAPPSSAAAHARAHRPALDAACPGVRRSVVIVRCAQRGKGVTCGWPDQPAGVGRICPPVLLASGWHSPQRRQTAAVGRVLVLTGIGTSTRIRSSRRGHCSANSGGSRLM